MNLTINMNMIAMTFAALALTAGLASAGDIAFFDDFENGPSELWGNEHGDWTTTANGVYDAAVQQNFPNTHSTLPFELTDFTIDVDIINSQDGGVWVRSQPAPSTMGVKGVLFVAKGGNVYWHIADDAGYGPTAGFVGGAYAANSTIHVRIAVTGNTYAAYLNGSESPVSTIETPVHPAGRVALYDFGGQTFDNVEVNGTSAPAPCPTDLDQDGMTGPSDLATLLSGWGDCPDCAADLNGDGAIDAGDLATLLAAWGPCAG